MKGCVALAAVVLASLAGANAAPEHGVVTFAGVNATHDFAKPDGDRENQQPVESCSLPLGAQPQTQTPVRKVKTQIYEDAQCGWGGCCYHISHAVCYSEVNCQDGDCTMSCS